MSGIEPGLDKFVRPAPRPGARVLGLSGVQIGRAIVAYRSGNLVQDPRVNFSRHINWLGLAL